MLRRTGGHGSERLPRNTRFSPAFRSRVVAAEAILLGDLKTVLNFMKARVRAARGDRFQNFFLVAELDPHHAPRDLGLVFMRQHLKAGCEFRIRDQVRAHVGRVILGRFGPSFRRLTIHGEHQNGVVCLNIGRRVAREVFVIADRDHHVCVRRGAHALYQFFELDSANFSWTGEVCSIVHREAHLGNSEKFLAGDISGGIRRQANQFAADLEVGRKLPLFMPSRLRLGVRGQATQHKHGEEADPNPMSDKAHGISYRAAAARQAQICDATHMLNCSSPRVEGDDAMAALIESRLKTLGITLPALPQPGGNYLPARTVGQMVYLAGVISIQDGEVLTGTVGAGRSIEEGYTAARACALTQLAVLTSHVGSLDNVKNIVTVNGYVNAVPGFPDSPKVINGASDLFVEIFGDAGRHVRAAIGVPALPKNAMVELQMTVEVR
jgi:enamine deaminase RidA (YjgF/YER057c/UK114 family)